MTTPEGSSARRAAGFTIVELLITIGILALLVGMLLPALSGAQKRSLKTREINQLRQVGLAWAMYATSNNDAALPGYLEPQVQRRWKVTFEYPNGEVIPPGPSFSNSGDNFAGPWTWRLMPLLDNNHAAVHGYAEEPEFDAIMLGEDPEEAREIAFEPSFGYNALFLGGWWEMAPMGAGEIPRPRYFDAADENGHLLSVVTKSTATIRRSSEIVTFCSSSLYQPGAHREFRDNRPGWHYVSPPLLAGEAQWGTLGSIMATAAGGLLADAASSTITTGEYDPNTLVVQQPDTAAPFPRYNGQLAIIYADNHTEAQTIGSLNNMRNWVDAADAKNWTFE